MININYNPRRERVKQTLSSDTITEQGMAYSIPQWIIRASQGLPLPDSKTFYSGDEVPILPDRMDLVDISQVAKEQRRKVKDLQAKQKEVENKYKKMKQDHDTSVSNMFNKMLKNVKNEEKE